MTLDKEAIFIDNYGVNIDEGLCLICNQNKIKINQRWKYIYYIPLNEGGKDIYPNAIPVCNICYSKINNKNLYNYLYNNKKMSKEEMELCINLKKNELNEWISICNYSNYINNSNIVCNNMRYGSTYTLCYEHLDKESDPMDIV